MSRITIMAAVVAAFGLLTPACGGKSKPDKTTPSDSNDKDTEALQATGPKGDNAGTTQPGDIAPDTPAAPADKPGDDQPAPVDTSDDTPEDPIHQPPPPVRHEPPVLDISAAEKKARVKSHLGSARSALRSRDAARAISEAKAALTVDPWSVDSLVALAHGYYYKKLDRTAYAVLDRALKSQNVLLKKRAKKHAGVYYILGLIYDREGDQQRARLAYETGHAQDKEHKGILMNLGVHYLRQSRYKDAQRLFASLVGARVTTAATFTNLGSAYRGQSASSTIGKAERRRQLLAAETAYKRAIDRDKNYSNAYYNLGLLYMDGSPFPRGNGTMDKLARMERAKTYFDEYRALPGAKITLVDERIRRVAKSIKKEKKRRKKKKKQAANDDDW